MHTTRVCILCTQLLVCILCIAMHTKKSIQFLVHVQYAYYAYYSRVASTNNFMCVSTAVEVVQLLLLDQYYYQQSTPSQYCSRTLVCIRIRTTRVLVDNTSQYQSMHNQYLVVVISSVHTRVLQYYAYSTSTLVLLQSMHS